MKRYKIKEITQVEHTWTIRAKNKEDAKRILKQGKYDNGELLSMPTYKELNRGKK